jgi:DNA processing protein
MMERGATDQIPTSTPPNRDDSKEELEQLLAAIELSRLPGVGAARFKELVDRHGSPAIALSRTPRQVEIPGSQVKTSFDPELIRGLANQTGGAPDYPWLLRAMTEPPPYLFRRGVLWPIPPVTVAVVGPRGCTPEGTRFAYELSAGLAARGVIVVSGGAMGIDAAAHRGALEAGGYSLLVTATGVDRVYPKENAALFRGVVERGCLLTELLPGTPPRRDFFPTRNRIIVGLSEAVVVVEGRLRTGTWSSASHALRQGRPLLTWGGSPRPELRELSNLLGERGARPLDQPDAEVVMAAIKPGSTAR